MKAIKYYFAFFLAIVLCFCVYLMQISSAKIVYLKKSFTFITMQSSGIAACATQIQLDGGAGFLLKDNKNVEVALSVYLKEENAILGGNRFENFQ